MSRIGKKPVAIPAGVTARLDGQSIAVKGAKGELTFIAPKEVRVSIDGGAIHVVPQSEEKRARAMWGTARARIQNLVAGVTKGFEKKLEINGVGYKAAIAGKVSMKSPIAPPRITKILPGNELTASTRPRPAASLDHRPEYGQPQCRDE